MPASKRQQWRSGWPASGFGFEVLQVAASQDDVPKEAATGAPFLVANLFCLVFVGRQHGH